MDLYTFHPQCSDVSGKALKQWIQKIKLSVRPGTGGPDKEDEGEEEEK